MKLNLSKNVLIICICEGIQTFFLIHEFDVSNGGD